ncbi:MAG: hypothetical protein H6968_09415 [Chromatiaceae bacterium]|nr:hypothetical protein [Chromatiaceae bacterium]
MNLIIGLLRATEQEFSVKIDGQWKMLAKSCHFGRQTMPKDAKKMPTLRISYTSLSLFFR